MRQKELNILAVYHQATREELRAGLSWYADVNEECARLAQTYRVTMQQAAGVIAALSPGLRWENNVEAAERMLAEEPLDGLGVRWYANVRKAEAILNASDPFVALKGNKVRAFYACILTPDKGLSVCVDGHAYCIWTGRRIGLDKVPELNDRLYNRIASDYMSVARVVQLQACQLQAITWLTWRRLHNA